MTPTPAARIRPPDLGFVLVPRVLQFVAVDADGDGALAQLGQLELLELVRVHILGVLGLRCRYDAVGENLACGALTLRLRCSPCGTSRLLSKRLPRPGVCLTCCCCADLLY